MTVTRGSFFFQLLHSPLLGWLKAATTVSLFFYPTNSVIGIAGRSVIFSVMTHDSEQNIA